MVDVAQISTYACIFGGLLFAFVAVYLMDCLSAPAERRRRIALELARTATSRLRNKILDILFPEKKHGGVTDEEEELNDDECAICMEPFRKFFKKYFFS